VDPRAPKRQQRGQLLRAAVGFAGLPRPHMTEPSGHSEHGSTPGQASVTSLSECTVRASTTTDAVRRSRLARDVLHDRDGTLADQRDRHRLGADAVVRDTAGGLGGGEQGLGGNQ